MAVQEAPLFFQAKELLGMVTGFVTQKCHILQLNGDMIFHQAILQIAQFQSFIPVQLAYLTPGILHHNTLRTGIH